MVKIIIILLCIFLYGCQSTEQPAHVVSPANPSKVYDTIGIVDSCNIKMPIKITTGAILVWLKEQPEDSWRNFYDYLYNEKTNEIIIYGKMNYLFKISIIY